MFYSCERNALKTNREESGANRSNTCKMKIHYTKCKRDVIDKQKRTQKKTT